METSDSILKENKLAARKKSPPLPAPTTLATSQIIAMAERALENGAEHAIIIYLDSERGLGFSITEEASPEQVVFMMRQAEHIFLSPDFGSDD